jgi:hypothetical protein
MVTIDVRLIDGRGGTLALACLVQLTGQLDQAERISGRLFGLLEDGVDAHDGQARGFTELLALTADGSAGGAPGAGLVYHNVLYDRVSLPPKQDRVKTFSTGLYFRID